MSRIGKKPISIPKGVTVTIGDGVVRAKGPKGELSRAVPTMVDVLMDQGGAAGSNIVIQRQGESRQHRAMHGLARTLVSNLVQGVSQGFTRVLEVNGVGYRAEVKGRSLILGLGYSHPIEVMLPPGIEAKVEKNLIQLSGIDAEVLGQLAAVIRDQRPPEPYKGKGIRYSNEVVRRKEGKAGAS